MLSMLLALASAFAAALNAVTQHVASTAAPPEDRGWRLALYLVRSPLWLFGVGAMLASFALQALALYRGHISVVQTVLVSELVFSLVIGRVWLRRTVVRAAWASAAVTGAGLALFLIMAEPKGGHTNSTSGAWLPALLTFGGITAGFVLAARHATPVRRAAFYACGAGVTGALLATFLKSATDTLGQHGFVSMLERGALYGLVLAGILSAVLTQAALHYGPLAVSQPLMLIVDPVVSIALGIWIFGEHFQGGWWKIVVGTLGFAVMGAGAFFLARTAPSLAAAPDLQGLDSAPAPSRSTEGDE
jgi:drug/metabolite transporter (DMT)-like permease